MVVSLANYLQFSDIYDIISPPKFMARNSLTLPSTSHIFARLIIWSGVIICILISIVLVFILRTKIIAFDTSSTIPTEEDSALNSERTLPLGVNPKTKTVTENPAIDTYIGTYVASNYTPNTASDSWLTRLTARLALMDWYQNLASPISRVLVIESGDRKEEVVADFSKILGWDKTKSAIFLERIKKEVPVLPDGKLYPGTYVVEKDADPETVAIVIADRFNAEVRSRYSDEIEGIVPLRDALIIASLLEREASDFEDMRYISGIIWNRLFIDMRLQLDATMQYAKATNSKTPLKKWWSVPVPADKFIDSKYNTYKYAGLPPGPIANPSIDAIIAALNPKQTNCLFYFHDQNGGFHCSVTYAEHVAALKATFGQGK